MIKIAFADGHALLRNALSAVINDFDNCRVIIEADNGLDLKNQILTGPLPDVVLLDLSMPLMDGHDSACWLKKHYPEIPVLMLTMFDSELALVRLLHAGVKGFLRKDIEPAELKYALQSVKESGFYYSNSTAGKLANLFRNSFKDLGHSQPTLPSEQEMDFLRLACTDLTYKEIAHRMSLSPRTIDHLRDHLFTKLEVRSRVGLAIVALKNGLVNI